MGFLVHFHFSNVSQSEAVLRCVSDEVLIEFSVARLVGVGEASFISLAAPFIDDNAPASQVYHFFLFYFDN